VECNAVKDVPATDAGRGGMGGIYQLGKKLQADYDSS
jgi:hypothetical protein